MTDAPDLARRFLSVWGDHLTALFEHPFEVEVLRGWIKAGSGLPRDLEASDHSRDQHREQTGSPADAAPIAGTSGECRDLMAELAGRLARLEERLAVVERRGAAASRPRRRNRRIRTG
jgi:hypothetical protein